MGQSACISYTAVPSATATPSTTPLPFDFGAAQSTVAFTASPAAISGIAVACAVVFLVLCGAAYFVFVFLPARRKAAEEKHAAAEKQRHDGAAERQRLEATVEQQRREAALEQESRWAALDTQRRADVAALEAATREVAAAVSNMAKTIPERPERPPTPPPHGTPEERLNAQRQQQQLQQQASFQRVGSTVFSPLFAQPPPQQQDLDFWVTSPMRRQSP